MSASCQILGQSPSLRHLWTPKERKALVLLRDEYQLAWEILTPIFNRWLDADQGVRQRVLYAQYSYFSRPATSSKQKNAQTAFSFTNEDLETLHLELERIGLKLGIKIHRQFSMHDSEYSQIHNDALKRKRSSGTLHADSEETDEPAASSSKKHQRSLRQTILREQSSQPSSPILAIRGVRRNLFNPASSSGLPVPLSRELSATMEDLPPLGFRGFSERSQGLNSPLGFRAGAFIHAARIPVCPHPTDAEFLLEANLHVGWTEGHPSPFISVTTSCIRAIMRSRSPKSGRYLAVLDLRKIRSSGSIFEAKSLGLRPTNPNGDPIAYHSGGEYLVWVRNSSII